MQSRAGRGYTMYRCEYCGDWHLATRMDSRSSLKVGLRRRRVLGLDGKRSRLERSDS